MELFASVAIIIGVVAYVIYLHLRIREYARKIDKMAATHIDELERRNKSQRATVKGQLAEQMYPLLPSCPYLPSDMRFIGHPVDYIIFDGYTETKDGNGDIREVILADIKTGNASLSKHQRAIRDAVIAGRVRWLTIKE